MHNPFTIVTPLLADLKVFETQLHQKYGRIIKLSAKEASYVMAIDEIAIAVCKASGLAMQQVLSKNRSAPLVEARSMCIFIAYTVYGCCSKSELARYFNLDHTSIIHNLKRVQNLLDVADEATVACYAAAMVHIEAATQPPPPQPPTAAHHQTNRHAPTLPKAQ